MKNVISNDAWDLRVRLQRLLELQPGAPALEFEERWLPWRYFGLALAAFRSVLDQQGVPGDLAIAFATRNRPAHAATLVALLIEGRCSVTVNPFVAPEKFAADVAKLGVGMLIADEDDWESPALREWTKQSGTLGIALGKSLEAPVLRVVTGLDASRIAGFKRAEPGVVAIEMLTSGTTGEPKRIPMTYTMLNTSLRDGVRSGDGGSELQLKRSPALLYAPLVHAGGVFGLMLSMYEGRCVALLEKFTVEGWSAAMRRHRPRFASLVPTLIRMILEAKVPREDLSSLIAVRSGTAPLDADTHRAFEETYGIPILINYGSTEFAGAVSGWTLPEYQKYGKAKFGSVGRARADVRLRIIDPQTGAELPAGTVGVLEIWAGRVGSPQWQRTTDLALLDEDGFLFMHGRADDAIIRGGFKVLPEQVADVLRRHDAVSEAVVVGIPDARLGQVPVAAIEIKPGRQWPDVQELDAFAREHLVAYQVPTRFLLTAELPRTPSLKVSRPAVRALFEGA